MKNAIFIYIRKGEYRCLDLMAVSLKVEEDLKKRGWKHSATISADLWLEDFLNGNESIRFQKIEDISK